LSALEPAKLDISHDCDINETPLPEEKCHGTTESNEKGTAHITLFTQLPVPWPTECRQLLDDAKPRGKGKSKGKRGLLFMHVCVTCRICKGVPYILFH